MKCFDQKSILGTSLEKLRKLDIQRIDGTANETPSFTIGNTNPERLNRVLQPYSFR